MKVAGPEAVGASSSQGVYQEGKCLGKRAERCQSKA
jgi:hypothetical protein